MRYLVRHDPAQQLYGIALFGPVDTASEGERRPRGSDTQIPHHLIADAARLFGYRVLPTP